MSVRNRVETQVLYDTNFMGINGPNIAAHEFEYHGEHWPHNSSVGWTYSGALSALTAALAVPPPIAPLGASPAAPAAAGEAVAQAAAQSGMSDAVQASGQAGQAAGQAGSAPADAGNQLSSLLQQPMSMVSGMTQPLQEVFKAPMEAVQSIGSMPQGLMSMSGMFSAAGAPNAASAGAIAEPVLAGGGAAGGVGAAGVGGVGSGIGGFPATALTSYTRPTSSFEPETGGRPTSLRAGVLNAADVRGPTASTGMGGTPMPMSPAGMLARGTGGESDKDAVTRARVVIGGDPTDPQDA
jgi:PPE-repeat protein